MPYVFATCFLGQITFQMVIFLKIALCVGCICTLVGEQIDGSRFWQPEMISIFDGPFYIHCFMWNVISHRCSHSIGALTEPVEVRARMSNYTPLFYEGAFNHPGPSMTMTSFWALWRLKSPALRSLLKRLLRRRSKKTSKLRGTGLCAGNSPGTG